MFALCGVECDSGTSLFQLIWRQLVMPTNQL